MAAEIARPRIFATPDDISRIRAMASDTEANALGIVTAEGWKKIKARADALLKAKPYTRQVTIPLKKGGKGGVWKYTLSENPPPPHDDNPAYPVWTSMFQERGDSITTRIRFFMTAYLVTGEPKYFEAAKKMVMAFSAWPGIWTDPQYGGGKPCLDTGHAAVWVAIFYDWGHDALSPEERARVRTCLAEKALAPIAAHVPTLPVYHNYNTVVSCGLGIGALALMGEDDRAEGWVELAVSQMRKYMDAQGKDGGPMEGPMYGTYAGSTLSDLIWALQTAGYRNDLLEHPFLANLPRYCIAMANPNDYHLPTFGDGGATQAYQRTNRVLALAGNTDSAWYLQQVGGFGSESPRGFLALDPERVRPRQPEMNPSDCFIDVGYASLRDGYKRNAAYLAFKAGPPEKDIHHNHYDHNSFQINYAGHWLAGDPGYRNYYDPAPRKYTLSTFGHNSIVLDLDDAYLKTLEQHVAGHDQVRQSGARITEFFTSHTFDYVKGEAAVAYNPKEGEKVLERFDRQIVFVKPNIFFICDTLEAPQAHTYSFLLHTQRGGEFEIGEKNAIVRVGKNRGVLTAAIHSDTGPMRFSSGLFPDAEQYGPYMAATTSQRAKRAHIVTAIATDLTDRILVNPGFEDGMTGWIHRTLYDTGPNHKIDTEVKHGGNASGRIDKNGYYYSARFQAPEGATLRARFWAKADAPSASSRFYFWKGNKSFANAAGPRPEGDTWKEYTFAATVPQGTQEICLALNYSGDGSVWYDDINIRIEAPAAPTENTVVAGKPPKIAPVGKTEGLVCEKDGRTQVMLRGEAGKTRTIEAAGRKFTTDGQLAVVVFESDGPKGFLVGGSTLTVDGGAVPTVKGAWRAGP